ncbi:hypothetical protein RCC89_17270 [Cytophagaceae bacterium ABcell3]|nr:hypothetical protein RCC89_17270 [Cytophagaceae bacterium ABcell3]
MKHYLYILFIVLCSELSAQNIRKSFENNRLTEEEIDYVIKEYGQKKDIPDEFREQIATALLYFPELKDTRISFRIYDASSPLLARPTFFSAVFRNARRRHYIIGISNDQNMAPVLLENLHLDAQIGVLGHELAHIADFVKRDRIGLLGVALGNIHKKKMDRIEFDADRRTIDHGLGWQLYSWSTHVRLAYAKHVQGIDQIEDITEVTEHNPRERYMFPETIMETIKSHPIYQPIEDDDGESFTQSE